jgi:hypothetical protein
MVEILRKDEEEERELLLTYLNMYERIKKSATEKQ